MRLNILIAALLLTITQFAVPAFAWNDTGHMTVALIAYRQLDDATKQKVATILKAHPHYDLFLKVNKPDGVSEDEWAFLRAATWPDFVRPSRPGYEEDLFKGPEITHFHQGPWHYIDIPFVPPRDRKKMDPTTLPAREEPNALTAMNAQSKILAQADAKPQDRAVALAWMEHLIGDIHQPLHAVSMYSSVYPHGDKGGNSQAIKVEGGWVMNLHSFWDQILGTSDGYGAIDFVANEITNDPQLAKDKLPELTKDTSFESWAIESHDYAGSITYLNGRLRTASMDAWQAKQLAADEVPSLPPGYAINAHDLAKRRAAAAGYRLAQEISDLLSHN